jgi:hypothetical protein
MGDFREVFSRCAAARPVLKCGLYFLSPEVGIAVARMYLEQEFGFGNVEFMYKPDAEDKRRGTCSF